MIGLDWSISIVKVKTLLFLLTLFVDETNDSHIETRYTRLAFVFAYALVAHRDRVTASEAVGRGFESLRARHFTI